MNSILYIDDEQENLDVFLGVFQFTYKVFTTRSTKNAIRILKNNEISVVIIDQRMPGETGIEFIERVQEIFPDIVFMILSGYSDYEVAIQAIKCGRVYRFLQKPYKEETLYIEIEQAIEKHLLLKRNKELLVSLEQQNKELKELKEALEVENISLKSEIKSLRNFENIITQDPNLLTVIQGIENISHSDASVLIFGETGTGKELIARAVHNMSKRSRGPFIAVNCAAIPETLFESELFGHERGAFTGAISTKKGKFELATDGTIFLDEIGEIPMTMQAKLLRVLQEGCIERVGGTKLIKLNIRVICATNKNLEEEIKKDNFRSDLYYRLNVVPITLPSLKERTNDIPLLVDYFIDKYNKKHNRNINKIPRNILALFRAYDWPGNVRELENIIERAIITSRNNKLSISYCHFENEEKELPTFNLHEVERRHIISVLDKTGWRIGGRNSAAELLGIPRQTLQSKMKKLNIQKKL